MRLPFCSTVLFIALLLPSNTHAFTDGGWIQHPAAAEAWFYTGASAAMDTRRGRIIEIGGQQAQISHPQEIWSFDVRGTSGWTSLGPAPSTTTPNGIEFGAAAYDSLGDCVYSFGGVRSYYGSTAYSDTLWRLDLGQARPAWTIVAVPPGPVARKAHVLAFDALGRRLLLFGGRTAAGTALADFWTVDVDTPSAWAPITAPGPRARDFAAGSADQGRFVLAGGISNFGSALGDAWIFDFTLGSWANLGVTNGPQGVLTGAIDHARNRMVVLAKADSLACWQLSLGYATEWRPLVTSGFPPPVGAQSTRAVFDPVSDCLVDVNGDYIGVGDGKERHSLVVLHSLHFSPLPVVNVMPQVSVRYETGNSYVDLALTADRPLYGPIALDRVDSASVRRIRKIIPDPDGRALLPLEQLSPATHYDYRLAWFDGADMHSFPIPIDTPPAPIHLDLTVDSVRAFGRTLQVFWNVPNDSAAWLAKVLPQHRIGSGPWTSTYHSNYPVQGKFEYDVEYASGDTISFRLCWGPALEYASDSVSMVAPIDPVLVATGGNRAAAIAEFRVSPDWSFPTTLRLQDGPGPIEPTASGGLLHFEDPEGAARDGSGRYFFIWDVNGLSRDLPPIDIVVSSQDVDLLQVARLDSTAVAFTWKDPEPDWTVPLVLERSEDEAPWDSIDVLPPGSLPEVRNVVDATVQPARDYRYRLRWPQQGLSYVHSLELSLTTPGMPPDTTQHEPALALAFGAGLANPMRGVLALPVTTPAGEAAVLELFDASGRRVRRNALASAWSGTVSMEGLRGGMYFARLSTLSAQTTRKVVLLP